MYLSACLLSMKIIVLEGLVVNLYPDSYFVQFNSKKCGYSVVFRVSFDKMRRSLMLEVGQQRIRCFKYYGM
ncbi:Ovule protein [Vibrio crassostreae]|uniref:Uncharacterized protein n=1 Tax=Vibrio crassostreae TaxID=246167 RepID=A0A822MT81_9VIBR|nr:Ovule protein [Vibrio crassostreae]CAK1698738.1 Ovule protein [Vibrio crassostreae]CAK1700427.1 Ovule protein [Vibrio crassostreae]CAK1703779.1 Ovule protein [Vibrio crassostreae]CAK1718626.1 Ovule protein [Vibrio crassostreae]